MRIAEQALGVVNEVSSADKQERDAYFRETSDLYFKTIVDFFKKNGAEPPTLVSKQGSYNSMSMVLSLNAYDSARELISKRGEIVVHIIGDPRSSLQDSISLSTQSFKGKLSYEKDFKGKAGLTKILKAYFQFTPKYVIVR